MKKFTTKFHLRNGAFSLVELLVVIAIVSILMVAAVTAFTTIGRAGKLTKTGYDIAGLIEQARSYAMAQNTYVWIGFETDTNNSLVVGVVASRNGEASPAASDVIQLRPLSRFERVQLVALPADKPHREPEDGVTQMTSVTSAIFPFRAGSGPNGTDFNSRVIQFNGRGESRVVSSRLHKALEIGLQGAVDGNIQEPENYVAIHLGSLSGSVSVYRP
jgi:prepilin-type N-terminal cleavage/methylation domain-containing protein